MPGKIESEIEPGWPAPMRKVESKVRGRMGARQWFSWRDLSGPVASKLQELGTGQVAAAGEATR